MLHLQCLLIFSVLLQELAEEPVMSYDPLPPVDAIDSYSRSQSNRPNLDDPSVLGGPGGPIPPGSLGGPPPGGMGGPPPGGVWPPPPGGPPPPMVFISCLLTAFLTSTLLPLIWWFP